jgi:hypothetical protein
LPEADALPEGEHVSWKQKYSLTEPPEAKRTKSGLSNSFSVSRYATSHPASCKKKYYCARDNQQGKDKTDFAVIVLNELNGSRTV